MRFPSVAYLAGEARRSFARFPLVLISAMVAAAGGVGAVEFNQHDTFFLRFLFTGSLGLPLFAALGVHAEKNGLSRGTTVLLNGLAVLGLVGFFLIWPRWLEPTAIRRYIQLSLGFHLLAAVLPYLGRRRSGAGDLNGFWQYNRTLFLRFLTSALYAAVLYAGISIAILALDKLFGMNVAEETYVDLWIVCAFVLTTWIFVGGVPGNFNRLETTEEYPRGLRVFSQFILVPLVTLYLVILTLYMGKIAVTQVWPSGWIGYLVSSVAVVGILSLLLVFPVAGKEENRWMRTYSRWFYVALLPSVAMLLLAIFKRIEQYGITENRYFMVVLSVWLALIAVYFIFSRGKNIKAIPATLAVLTFAAFFGPWGAYAVSSRSQTQRLGGFLTEKSILVDGRIQKGTDLSFEDRREASAMIHYLVGTHGTDSIAPWFEDGLAWADTLNGDGRGGHRWQTDETAKRVMGEMGLPYVSRWEHQDQRSFNLWAGGDVAPIRISPYEYVFRVENLPSRPVALRGREYRMEYEERAAGLVLREDDRALITVPLGDLIEQAYLRESQPSTVPAVPDSLVVRAENEAVAVLLLLRSLSGYEEDGAHHLRSLSADVFLKRKQP